MAETTRTSLAHKLAAAIAEVEKLPKDGHNVHFNYDYVTESAAVEHIRKLLDKHGIFILPTVLCSWQEKRETSSGVRWHSFVQMSYRLIDTAPDAVSAEDMDSSGWPGEGMDSGDKGYYKAITGAQKYFLLKTFMIPTGDDPEKDDGNAASPAAKPAVQAPGPSQNTGADKTPGGASVRSLNLARGLFVQRGIALGATEGEPADVTTIRREQNCLAIADWLAKKFQGFETTRHDDELLYMGQRDISDVIGLLKAEIAELKGDE